MSHPTTKGGKVQAPDYGPIAAANEHAAQLSADVAREQLAWAKEQYAQDRGVTDQVLGTLLPAMQSESDAAAQDRARYQQKFQPLEDQLIQDAKDYASPQRIELEAGRAGAAVAQSFDAARRSAQANLESFGVDPTQTRAAALDIGTRTAQAAATAGAENQARINTENTGRALRGEAINIGKGYPGQVASAYSTAQNAGNSAIGGTNATSQTGGNLMGTGMGWQGLSDNMRGVSGNQVAGLTQAAWNTNTTRQGQFSSLMGSIMGGMTSLGTYAMMTGHRRGGAVEDDMPGGPLPPDPADPQGDQDRMAIRVSGGEFVIPKSVVDAKGTEFFDRLITKYGRPEDQQAAAHRLQTGAPGGERLPAIAGAQ